jgi:hypothetical protein
METEDKASILARGIANARKIMEKVEVNTGGTRMTQQPEINRAMYADDSDDREPVYLSEAEVAARTRTAGGSTPKNTMKNLSTSKMPKEILQSFIENPIVDPTVPVGMDSLMEKVAQAQPKMKQIQETVQPQNRPNQQQPAAPAAAPVMDVQLIEYIIKKTVETVLEEQAKKTSIDENFQIKIGDKVFGGKLNVLKENNNKASKK